MGRGRKVGDARNCHFLSLAPTLAPPGPLYCYCAGGNKITIADGGRKQGEQLSKINFCQTILKRRIASENRT
jgi:hypothetical protein